MRVEAMYNPLGKAYAYEVPDGAQVGDIISWRGAQLVISRLEAEYPGELAQAINVSQQEREADG